MSILGNPITLGGGGAELNIDFGSTPPTDTSKLWVPLSTKPDRVEVNNPSIIGSLITETIGNTAVAAAPAASGGLIGSDLYSFSGQANLGMDRSSKYIYKCNIVSGQIAQPYDKVSTVMNEGVCCAGVGGKLYLFGGYNSQNGTFQPKVRMYDPTTNTITDKVSTNVNFAYAHSVVYGTDIYLLCAGIGETTKVTGAVYKYDTTNDTFSYYMTAVSGTKYGVVSDNGNGKAYIFGCMGTYGGGSAEACNGVYEIDLISKTWKKKSAIIPGVSTSYGYTAAAFHFLGVYYLYPVDGTSNFLIYDPVSDTITDTGISGPGKQNFCAYGTYNNLGVMMNGTTTIQYNSGYTNIVRRITIKTPLAKNTIIVTYGDFGHKVSIVTGKNSSVQIAPSAVYIGDENGYAQEISGYVYDTATNKWTKLDGSSTYQDILNALNIMGVI